MVFCSIAQVGEVWSGWSVVTISAHKLWIHETVF